MFLKIHVDSGHLTSTGRGELLSDRVGLLATRQPLACARCNSEQDRGCRPTIPINR